MLDGTSGILALSEMTEHSTDECRWTDIRSSGMIAIWVKREHKSPSLVQFAVYYR